MKFPYNKALDIQMRYRDGKIDREAAKEELAFILDLTSENDFCEEALPEHDKQWRQNVRSYGPLLRLSDVCNTLRLWARTYATAVPGDQQWMTDTRKALYDAWQHIDLQISKSCLLDRLFFQDAETVRTEPCPEHKGNWSGCVFEDLPCGCQNGSNVTGWLPKPEQVGYSDDPDAPLCDFCGKPPLKQGMWSSRVDGKHGHPKCMDANPYVPPKKKELTFKDCTCDIGSSADPNCVWCNREKA